MKFYITYFYNIRFLPIDCLPISTAIWDPKWYRMRNGYVWKDNRGVINGYRLDELHLPEEQYDNECQLSIYKCPFINDELCPFKKKYFNHLLTLDWNDLFNKIESAVKGYNCKDVCLMVHEKPGTLCAERHSLVKYFKLHNIDLIEFISPKQKLEYSKTEKTLFD